MFIFTASIPAWIVVLVAFFVPESARWWMTVGEIDKAEKCIRLVLKMNGLDPIKGQLEMTNTTIEERGQVKDLFVPKYRFTSLMLLTNFFIHLMTYIGVIFLSERIFASSSLYVAELVTTLSEIPAMVIGYLSLHRFGRRSSMI
jgi:magnesium-transporting ATPase (P-type)